MLSYVLFGLIGVSLFSFGAYLYAGKECFKDVDALVFLCMLSILGICAGPYSIWFGAGGMFIGIICVVRKNIKKQTIIND